MQKLLIADLWNEYQEKLMQGIDEPYIKPNDILVIHDENTLLTDGNIDTEIDKIKLAYAGMMLPVVQSYKVGIDLWYHDVIDVNHNVITFTDADIESVWRL